MAPVDSASLAMFRAMFGLLMAGYCVHMLRGSYLAASYINPKMLFTYYGFGWVQRLPLPALYGITVVMLLAALCFAAGVRPRISAGVFGLGWTYFFLLEKAYYINHFYLVSLLMFLFVMLPPFGSLTHVRSHGLSAVPAWALWAVRAQFAIVYFYAGLAKIQPDWLSGEPMRSFLRPYFESAAALDAAAYAFSWGGLAFDLLVVPGLLWRKTRVPTALLAVGFHLLNHQVFNIDFFPWLAIAGTLLFFEPDWPRRVLGRLVSTSPNTPCEKNAGDPTPRFVLGVLCVYFLIQLVVPFQRVLYPGNAHWTEEGQKFSWLLMMKHKTGSVAFTVVDLDTGTRRPINEKRYLNDRQILLMTGDPDMLIQFAHFLAREAEAEGAGRVAVFAETEVALNGRTGQAIVPPDLNLAAASRHWGHYDWILPIAD